MPVDVDPVQQDPLAARRTPAAPASLAPPESQRQSTGAAPVQCDCRPISPTALAWFAALIGWTLLLSLYDLDGGAGFEPTDAWIAQTAREMAESDDWRGYLVPTFSGETRLQKSPGPYWAVLGASYLRGGPVDEVSARLPNALFATLLVATIFWLTRRIAGDRSAIFAGFVAAGSLMILYGSHRAASDLGVTTLMTLSLAAFWVGCENEPPGRKRVALLLLAYFAAGLAMLYKMPMPLVCVGLPAALYILLLRRWRWLASWWHLAGFGLFLLPWVPWVISVLAVEPIGLDKWRVEFFDRFTGELPNVNGQQADWRLYLLYVGVAFVFSVPFCLSIPQALVRGFRRQAGVDRRGTAFLLIWFLGLLAFFTASAGKETRYFLPAMPPLLMLLGIELASFFDPQRRARPRVDRIGVISVLVLVPALVGIAGWQVWRQLSRNADKGALPWEDLWPPLAVAFAIFYVAAAVSAWLFLRRREHLSFAALVVGMWGMWLWAWPNAMPVLASQSAFRDFAADLRALKPEQQQRLRQIAQQDPRITWYSDVRFPRIIDQLELLELEGGKRDLEREMQIVGERIVEYLEEEQLALLVAAPGDYAKFQGVAPAELAKRGRTMPANYIWRIAQTGPLNQRFVLFGNQPPPWPAPTAAWLEKWVNLAREAHQRLSQVPSPPARRAAGDPMYGG